MAKKCIIYFDNNEARLKMLEIAFKDTKNLDFFAYKSFSEDSFRIEEYNPDLVILEKKVDLNCKTWVLGEDVSLPFNPIRLKQKILEYI